jgi:hypothetical protein
VKAKHVVILKGLLVLAVLWAGVLGIRSLAASKKVTAASIHGTVSSVNFEDWSQETGSQARAEQREKQIRGIAEMVNQLDFAEREKNREMRTNESFYRKLNARERNLYVDLTVVESMSRFMQALDQMPEHQRREFVEKGLKEIQAGRTEEEMARAMELDQSLLLKISQEGMRAYFDKASADTKLDLAPLMQAMNEVMQGMRGNQFGPR